MVKKVNNDNFSELRQRAQTFLKAEPGKTDMFQDDTQRLVHELHTHQIELELQNEDLQNAQQELEKSHRRYADLYDFAPVAYITVSDKGMIMEANLTAGDMLGVARGELLGRPFSAFLCADDQDVFYLNRKKMLETGEQQSFELRLLKSDKTLIYGLVETAIHGEESDPPVFRVTVSDISDRKEAERAVVRHLQNRYRAIVMDQNDLICRFDSQGRITFVNDAYCSSFGVNQKEIIGTNYLPRIYEEDVHLVREHFKNLTQLAPNKTIEHRVYLSDGKIHWQQWSGRVLYDEAGNVFEYQAVGRDITKLKETEEELKSESRLRQLFLDALPCIAMLLESGTRQIVASNKAAAEVGAVPGQLCYAAWAKRKDPCSWCLAPRLWSENKHQNTQFWAFGIYWDAYWVPVDEKLYLHYIFDITEKQKNKEALKKANEELEQRVLERTLELQKSHEQLLHSEKLAAVGNLSASIAHEFNNPLQSVMTIIKGIEQYVPMPDEETELVSLALQECQRMKSLITDLQDFVLPTSGKLVQVDLHAAIDSLLSISKKDFMTRNIKIVKEYADNFPTIMAVDDQLKQVFLNLLNNAADACKEDGVITISTETIPGEKVAVHIEDNGIGIPAENITRIFEPFFTTKPDIKGTGLGLSVSYGIIKKHGGRIDLTSEPGKGTRFSIILPIKSDNNEHKIDIAG